MKSRRGIAIKNARMNHRKVLLEKEEVFKPIYGFEGLYEISSHGRVRSLERMRINRRGEFYISQTKIMHVRIDTRGHDYVNLENDGKFTTRRIRWLVVNHFTM